MDLRSTAAMVVMEQGYPARAEAVPLARHAAARCARTLGADESVAQAVALAVTEACANAVLHAYREREEPGEMTVSVDKQDDFLCVNVVDDGVGMVPRLDSPGLGMGLPLISKLTAAVELRSRPEGGCHVRMRFDLAPQAAAA